MRHRVKICGIGTLGDLNAAVEAGADAIGLIVGATHVTEDELDTAHAQKIAAAAPVFVTPVLVTHLVDPEQIIALADAIGVDTIQAHAGLTADASKHLWKARGGRRIIRAVHVSSPDSVGDAAALAPLAHALLLDSRTASRLGGTGLTHDWHISQRIVERVYPTPVILAGGLAADNVGSAIRLVNPFAVDANSRLKDQTGRKDLLSCCEFVNAVNSAETALV